MEKQSALVQAIIEGIQEKKGSHIVIADLTSIPPAAVVGRTNAQWVAMDYGTDLVHIFLPDVRDYYDLEHLWEDAEITAVPDVE